MFTLNNIQIQRSKERKKNYELGNYEAVASAFKVVDSQGYLVPTSILSLAAELVPKLGTDRGERFKDALAIYQLTKNSKLHWHCSLDMELLNVLALEKNCTFVIADMEVCSSKKRLRTMSASFSNIDVIGKPIQISDEAVCDGAVYLFARDMSDPPDPETELVAIDHISTWDISPMIQYLIDGPNNTFRDDVSEITGWNTQIGDGDGGDTVACTQLGGDGDSDVGAETGGGDVGVDTDIGGDVETVVGAKSGGAECRGADKVFWQLKKAPLTALFCGLDRDECRRVAKLAKTDFKNNAAWVPVKGDPNRKMIECFKVDSATELASSVNAIADSVLKAFVYHFDCKQKLKHYTSIIRSEECEDGRSCQQFHKDSTNLSVCHIILFLEDDGHVDINHKNSVYRVGLNGREGILFSDDVHRGTDTSATRLHIRIEDDRRKLDKNNAWIHSSTFNVSEEEQSKLLSLPLFTKHSFQHDTIGSFIFSFNDEWTYQLCSVGQRNNKPYATGYMFSDANQLERRLKKRSKPVDGPMSVVQLARECTVPPFELINCHCITPVINVSEGLIIGDPDLIVANGECAYVAIKNISDWYRSEPKDPNWVWDYSFQDRQERIKLIEMIEKAMDETALYAHPDHPNHTVQSKLAR